MIYYYPTPEALEAALSQAAANGLAFMRSPMFCPTCSPSAGAFIGDDMHIVCSKCSSPGPSVLKLAEKAQAFYEQGRSRTLVSGYERNVLVREDVQNAALFVTANYEPQQGDVIFRCQTVNRETVITLK